MISDATKIAIIKTAPTLSHIELIELVEHECELSTQRTAAKGEDTNLSCKSTQARLAASWGYVKAQPLTDEQIEAIWREGIYSEGMLYEFTLYAREIEQAHGIGCKTTLVKE